MVLYYFYMITHPMFPLLKYIGSTNDFNKRKQGHKHDCYNESRYQFNNPLYNLFGNNEY